MLLEISDEKSESVVKFWEYLHKLDNGRFFKSLESEECPKSVPIREHEKKIFNTNVADPDRDQNPKYGIRIRINIIRNWIGTPINMIHNWIGIRINMIRNTGSESVSTWSGFWIEIRANMIQIYTGY